MKKRKLLFMPLLILTSLFYNKSAEAQTIGLLNAGLNTSLLNNLYKVTRVIKKGSQEEAHDSKIWEFRSEGVLIIYESLDPGANKSIVFIKSVINVGSGKWKFSFKSENEMDNLKEFILVENKEGFFNDGFDDGPKVVSVDIVFDDGVKLKMILEKVDLFKDFEEIEKCDINSQWKSKYTDEFLKRMRSKTIKQ